MLPLFRNSISKGWNAWGVFYKGRKVLSWTLEKRELELKEKGIPKRGKSHEYSWKDNLYREITSMEYLAKPFS